MVRGNARQVIFSDDAGLANGTCTPLTVPEPSALVIPEPSTFTIWALGVLGLGWYAWRKRK